MSEPSDTPPLAPDLLLVHADFVRRVVRSLLTDESRVDDVVQQTWLQAVRSPPRHRDGLGSWLARLARHFALREIRSDERRRRRERDVAPGERIPSTEVVVAQLEGSRRVVDAVLELEEPLRSLVLDRYFNDLPAAEISRRRGVPAATVRAQLRRAHGVLKARLAPQGRDRGIGPALTLLAFPNSTTAGAARLTSRGLLMSAKTKTVVAAAVVVLAALGGWRFLAGPDRPGSRSDDAALETAHAETQPGESPVDPQESESATRAELPGVEEQPSFAVSSAGEDQGEGAADGGGFQEPTREDIQPLRIKIPAGVLEGLVLAGKKPLAEGRVHLKLGHSFAKIERPWRNAEDVQSTILNDDGTFRFTDLATGEYVVGVETAAGLLHEVWHSVDAEERGRRLVVVLGAGSVHGSVFDADGRAMPRAVLQLDARSDAGKQLPAGSFHLFATTGPDGSYRIDHLLSGSYWLSVARDGNYQPWFSEKLQTETIEISVGEDLQFDLGRAGPWPLFAGDLQNASGASVPGPASLLMLRVAGGYSRVQVDASGRFEGRMLPGRYDVEVHLQSGEVKIPGGLTVADGDGPRVLVVPGTTVHGQILSRSGTVTKAPDRFRVWLQPAAGRRGRNVPVQPEGSYRFDGLPPGRYTLSLHPDLGHVPKEIELREGEIDRRLDLVLPDHN